MLFHKFNYTTIEKFPFSQTVEHVLIFLSWISNLSYSDSFAKNLSSKLFGLYV